VHIVGIVGGGIHRKASCTSSQNLFRLIKASRARQSPIESSTSSVHGWVARCASHHSKRQHNVLFASFAPKHSAAGSQQGASGMPSD